MRRRWILRALGGAALPVSASAQAPVHSIGILSDAVEGDTVWAGRITVLREALARLGWVEGRNLRVLIRWAGGDPALIRAAAEEFAALHPDLVVASGAPNTAALKRLAPSLPVIFLQVADPVGSGLVPSLAGGGSVTGFTHFEFAMVGKWLALLREIAPEVSRVLVLQSPANPAWPGWQRAAAEVGTRLGVAMLPVPVLDRAAIAAAMAQHAATPGGGLIALPDTITSGNRDLLIAEAARLRLPAIYPFRAFALDGGLMAYGPDVPDTWRRAASYADRILRGEAVSTLPVQAPTRYELTINQGTARALGLALPPALLASADEVIE